MRSSCFILRTPPYLVYRIDLRFTQAFSVFFSHFGIQAPPYHVMHIDVYLQLVLNLKPSAHSRFLSLRHAIVGFSSCRTQQIFIVDRYKARSTPPWNFFKRCVGMILRGKFACQHSYLCFSIGLVSHVFHDFCRDTPHTADFCFWSLAIKNKYQTCLISKLSLLR